jgi:hypothetical protein
VVGLADANRFQRGAPGYGQSVTAAELKQKLSLARDVAAALAGTGDAGHNSERGGMVLPISSRSGRLLRARPLRDQMGIAGGVRALPWMFTATFVTLIVAQPIYGALVARLPRVRFIPIVYHFFVANLLLFWLLLTFDVAPVIVPFVWPYSTFCRNGVLVVRPTSSPASKASASSGSSAPGHRPESMGPVITIARRCRSACQPLLADRAARSCGLLRPRLEQRMQPMARSAASSASAEVRGQRCRN